MRRGLHVGWKVERCRFNFRERVFAEQWIRENKKQSGINFGHGILQDLFAQPYGALRWIKWRLIISRRDAFIVATVVQWLGTNVGWCFLERCIELCGYKLVPTTAWSEDSPSRKYYDHANNGQSDGSIWYNFAMKNSRSFSPKPDPLPPRLQTKRLSRQHLRKPLPGPRNYVEHCVRCKHIYKADTFMNKQVVPPCGESI